MSDQYPSDGDATTPFPLRGAWERTDMEAFLSEAVVPVRLACRTPGGGLWMLSLWYRYRDDALWCSTARDADLVEYLRADDGVAFEVSVNDPPYMGVRGQGTATIDSDPEKEDLRTLVERYLGDTDSDLAQWLLSDRREEVTIRIDPSRVYCWDYSERMADDE